MVSLIFNVRVWVSIRVYFFFSILAFLCRVSCKERLFRVRDQGREMFWFMV